VEWFEGMSHSLLKRPLKREEPMLRGMDLEKAMTTTVNSKFRVKTYVF